ncbi:MAG: VPLPA-CTERM sorting domain-containing protein [Rhodobacteraceae bacterium]|nr:VPLPA-CTERM sorting domain-containing protein [Paracoccaceae bacterium]
MTFRSVISALAVAAGLTLPAAASAATYTETFPYSGPNQEQSLASAGWCGGNAGDAYCQAPTGGEGAVSSGTGRGGTQGFAFWSQRGIGADSFLFTDEFTFRTSANPILSWYQRDSGVSDPMRIALLIGTDWYISDTVYQQPVVTDWLLRSAELDTLTWFVRGTGGNTAILPGGGVGTGGVLLPADQLVSAFGFWWDGPKTANSRIDDVTVNVIPVPAALPLLLAGLGGLALVARRRKAG